MELRKQPRVELAFRVVAYFKDIPIAVEAIDVSTGGIAVRSSRRLEPGSGVRMSFFLSDGRPTEIDGVIVRVRRLSSTIWLWGVAFHGLEPSIDARLRRWLDDAQVARNVAPPVFGHRTQGARERPSFGLPAVAPWSGRGELGHGLGRALSGVELSELYRAASDQLRTARLESSTNSQWALSSRGRR